MNRTVLDVTEEMHSCPQRFKCIHFHKDSNAFISTKIQMHSFPQRFKSNKIQNICFATKSANLLRQKLMIKHNKMKLMIIHF